MSGGVTEENFLRSYTAPGSFTHVIVDIGAVYGLGDKLNMWH